ncbi:UNVERIFIED_CONTAM: hypothetical protein Sradi_6436400 [Sesamum radiatum]|uniref:Gag-pol polyprotein n=1 Tax=Sesamum radiatum TaxID=300843 RepID=A0AAW2K4S2_SESRA
MIRGSSVQKHGVMMLSLVEKPKDLLADLKEEETYNINGLEESLHEFINILVKYEVMTKKSAPMVLVGEASTCKAKDKVAGREKRKKGETSSTVASTSSAPITPLSGCKGKRKRVCQSRILNDVCIYGMRRAIGRESVLNSSRMKV